MYESMWSLPGMFSEFDRLQRQLDEMFGWAGLPVSIRAVAPGSFPAVNIGGTPSSVEVYAFAPGVDASKIDVTLDRGLLTLAGERSSPVDQDSGKLSVYSRERPSGSFKRTISLPDDVDPTKVQARYRDGVLHVSIARREDAQPKRITVQ